MSEWPGLAEVKKLDIQPGDRVVLRLAELVSDQMAHEMTTRLREVLDLPEGARLILLEPGMDLEAVR